LEVGYETQWQTGHAISALRMELVHLNPQYPFENEFPSSQPALELTLVTHIKMLIYRKGN